MRRAHLSAIDLLLPVNRSSTKSYGHLSVYDYLMSRRASSQDDTRPLLRAPLWGDLLDRAMAQILATPTSARTSRMALVESAAEATDQAEFRLVHALEHDAPRDADVVAKSVAEAVTLMTAVDALSQRDLGRPENEHPDLVQQFRRRLSGHEDAILAGGPPTPCGQRRAKSPQPVSDTRFVKSRRTRERLSSAWRYSETTQLTWPPSSCSSPRTSRPAGARARRRRSARPRWTERLRAPSVSSLFRPRRLSEPSIPAATLSLAQAELITLTRLTRAITAITMLEPRREARPTNGRPKR
jgi:hypothetical protein